MRQGSLHAVAQRRGKYHLRRPGSVAGAMSGPLDLEQYVTASTAKMRLTKLHGRLEKQITSVQEIVSGDVG